MPKCQICFESASIEYFLWMKDFMPMYSVNFLSFMLVVLIIALYAITSLLMHYSEMVSSLFLGQSNDM